MTRAAPLLSAILLGAACATAAPAPAPPSPRDPESLPHVDTTPRDARAIEAPKRAPVLTHEACSAEVDLVRASPLVFEASIVRVLVEVELVVRGPVGLVASLEHFGPGVPAFDRVALPPLVALRLPPGPARDAPAGGSGALYDFAGFALAGLVNVALLPVALPAGIVTGQLDRMFMSAPTTTDRMFNDAVMDDATWQAEVARRAAPHAAVLAKEAARQQRFAAWRDTLLLQTQAFSCTVDDSGACTIKVLWPFDSARVRMSGLSCAEPPKPPPKSPPKPPPEEKHPLPPPPPPTFHLVWLPEETPPMLLALPPRDREDVRGDGARAMATAWREHRAGPLAEEDARPLWERARKVRVAAKERGALVDQTLACSLRMRARDVDADGSPPEMRLRLAFGFGDDVVGQTWVERSTWQRTFAVEHITLLPGELVKLSVMDVDAFVDDWIGMDVVVFDGRTPLVFEHPSFAAECRVLPP